MRNIFGKRKIAKKRLKQKSFCLTNVLNEFKKIVFLNIITESK